MRPVPLSSARPEELKQEPAKPLAYTWACDRQPCQNEQYLIKGVIQRGTLIVIFGESGSGKTYFTLDLALAIAGGQPWRGRRVTRGLVLYLAMEGRLDDRIEACVKRGITSGAVPVAISQRAADLLHLDGDVDGLVATVRHAESESGEKIGLIVVDTLARALAGGSENNPEDMGALILNADRLRHETGAAVVLIHHAGKDASRGARGHSSLKGAVDTEILVEGADGRHTSTVTKQRDLPSGQVFAFELEQQVLGHDDEGDPFTACIVKHQEDQTQTARHRPRSKQQLLILNALEGRQREAGKPLLWSIQDLTPLLNDLGVTHRNSRRTALLGLVEGGFLTSNGGCYSLKENCT
jgi:RecA-family ATPase